MASQPSEERNRLRLQAWEQRNQETGQAKEQNPENVPLFREPYKTNKGDELSSRIQKMLGSYEENGTTEPLVVSSSITAPLANCIHPSTEPPFQQVQNMPNQSQKGPPASTSSTQPFNSPNLHEHVSKRFLNHNQLSHSPQHKLSAHKDNITRSHEKQHSSDAKPLPLLHSNNYDNTEPKDMQLITFDRPQRQGFTENTSNPAKSMEVSCKDASPPPNRNIGILQSQAFHPPLSSKQPNVAVTQKPTAYVRPMDGPDQVVSESPELKPSPEHFSPLPELILSKSTQEKTTSLPLFLETTSDVQRVEDILKEMTCSWPPLLTRIQTPLSEKSSKSQFSVKEVEHVSSPPEQKKDQVPTTAPPHLHQSSSNLSAEVHSSAVSSSDSESGSKSESDGESATDDLAQPVLSSSLKTEPAAVSMAPGDWQLDKFIPFSQQNYRCKSQAVHACENLKPTDSSKHLSDRDAPDPQLSQKQKRSTDNPTPPQQSRTGSQETHYQQSSHNVLLKSTQPSDPVKPTLEENRKGVVSVHFDQTSSKRVKEARLNNRPKGKTGGQRKQIKGCSVLIESEVSDKPNRKKAESEVGPAGSRVQCTSCMKPPSQCDPKSSAACVCGKSKAETGQKKATKSSQKTKCVKKKDSLDSHKGTQPLVVRINLSLLSRIPPTCSFTERPSVVIQHRSKTDKPHKVTKTSRKTDKADRSCPKKKQKLECNDSTPQSSYLSEAPDPIPSQPPTKKARKTHESLHPLSAPRGSTEKSKKLKLCTGDTPQSNKEDMKCPKSYAPRKSSGKRLEHSDLKKPTRESVSNRPLLKFEEHRHYPVKHFIKEAKKLKHKADAEMDKLSKILNYLEAAVYFIESGIAMEREPHISMSSYTMFAETVELIKFVLKLVNSEDPSPTENDLFALCLKCQALLQMAMFHHKQKTALKYSKALIDHFNSSSQPAPEPSTIKGNTTPMSPAISSATTPNHSSCGPAVGPFTDHPSGTVVVPQDIGQVAFAYVNITALFLNAYNIWGQAEEYVNKGSGLLTELDTLMGALSLTSTMSSTVCYIRQGAHWLRMDCQKGK